MAAPTVTISGKVLLPTGAGAEGGRIEVALSQAGTVDDLSTSQSQRVGGKQAVAIAADGSVSFTVVPNQSIAPTGTWYEALFRLPGGVEWRELWQLNTSPSTIDIGDVPQLGAGTPGPAYVHLTEVDTLPAADASWRGKLIFLRGASGQPDQLLAATKNADGTYGWTAFGSGLP